MDEKLNAFYKKLGVNPDAESRDQFGFTHLHWAIIDKNVDAVAHLLTLGADPQAVASNEFNQFAEPPKYFLDQMKRFKTGFDDANFWGVRELTPLHIAASLNSVEIMKLLFEHGAIFDPAAYPDLNPVHCALCADSRKSLHALLRNGFDVDGKDRESRTMLHWIAMYEAGPRVAIFLGGFSSRYAMKLEDPVAAARAMLEEGASVDVRDGGGHTPLHLAAATNMCDVAEVLLEYGANVNAENHSGATPLHLTAWFNSKETAELLVERGAQIDSKDAAGNTPLHIAIADDSLDAPPGVFIPHGSCCSRDGKNVVLNFLVEKGADIRAKNSDGHTPLSIAKSKRASDDTFNFLSQLSNN